MTHPEAEEYLSRIVGQISEHFDCVQIVASRQTSDGGTACVARGAGNWYARVAMCNEVVERNTAQTLAEEISKIRPPDSDSSENWKP